MKATFVVVFCLCIAFVNTTTEHGKEVDNDTKELVNKEIKENKIRADREAKNEDNQGRGQERYKNNLKQTKKTNGKDRKIRRKLNGRKNKFSKDNKRHKKGENEKKNASRDRKKLKIGKKKTKKGRNNKRNMYKKKTNKHNGKTNVKKSQQRKTGKTKPSKKIIRKTSKYKQRKNNQPEISKVSRQTCSDTISDLCLTNAMEVMAWEGNQVSNFIKQFKRYANFNKTSNNKKEKKGKFDPSIEYMKTASGNFTNFTGCTFANDSSSSYTKYMEVYASINNCSANVEAKCNRSDPVDLPLMIECNTEMSKVKALNEDCRDKTITSNADSEEACTCWKKMKDDYMTPLKEKQCNPKMSTMVKEMKSHKQACVRSFSDCKKEENKLPGLFFECMDFDVGETWNPNDTTNVKELFDST